VPVIASRVGGLQDVVQDGVNGCLVPPGDPSAIVNALRRLEDDGFREALARAARPSVASFDARATGRAMAALWRSLGIDIRA
jgi:glycosyltransferase involved in cell wall biosynthesis